MRVPGVGGPREVLAVAVAALEDAGLRIEAVAPVSTTRPIGPSLRSYANGAAIVSTELSPIDLLAELQHIERIFGRKQRGQRWRARPLDLDIILWSGGAWHSPGLTIPHTAFRQRDFVLRPAAAIAGDWRDPVTGLTPCHLHARLTRPVPLRRCAAGRALSSVGRATDF